MSPLDDVNGVRRKSVCTHRIVGELLRIRRGKAQRWRAARALIGDSLLINVRRLRVKRRRSTQPYSRSALPLRAGIAAVATFVRSGPQANSEPTGAERLDDLSQLRRHRLLPT